MSLGDTRPLVPLGLAALLYGAGLVVWRLSVRHLAPGVRPSDVAWNPATRFDQEGFRRLAALHTPRGWLLRRVGMLLIGACALFIVLAAIQALSLWL
jgi:hypothetical protein